MSSDAIGTIAVVVMFALACQALTVYAVVHLIMTGKGILPRRKTEEESYRPHVATR